MMASFLAAVLAQIAFEEGIDRHRDLGAVSFTHWITPRRYDTEQLHSAFSSCFRRLRLPMCPNRDEPLSPIYSGLDHIDGIAALTSHAKSSGLHTPDRFASLQPIDSFLRYLTPHHS
jgi:hypothetical protein